MNVFTKKIKDFCENNAKIDHNIWHFFHTYLFNVKIVTWQKPPLTCENAPFFHLFLIK